MQQFNMKQREEYKETELGMVPEDWEVVKLGNSNCVKSLRSGIEKFENSKHYLSTSSIENNNIKQIECDITYEKRPSRANMQPILNSVWFAKMKNTIKVYSFTKKNIDEISKYVLSTGFAGMLCSIKRVFPNYLELIFLSSWFNSIKDRVCHGSTQQAINNNDIKSFKIPLPPLPEQKKISYILLTIQEAKEKTENVINSLKELKKSIMKHLFTYGPVSLEKAEKVKLKETEIGMVPEGWNIIPLKEIAYFKNGINFEAEQKGDKGILTIDVLNMYGPEISVHLHKLYRVNKEIKKDYLLQDNDILFVRSSLKREGVGWTTLFKKINEPVTYCGFLIRARLNNENFDAEYLTNYLRTNIARSNLVSSSGKVAITNINQGMLGNIKVPKPNKNIQLQISSILSIMDLKIRAEENKKRTLEELFKSMLHNLMTAKIRVNNLEI